MPNYEIPFLPILQDVETKAVLRQLASAQRYLGELKGKAATIPNEAILINTLTLQEAKESSAIENIITTYDEMYKMLLFENMIVSPAAKEVNRYAEALKEGYRLVKSQQIISQNSILKVQEILEGNQAGYRKLPGTKLVNEHTGEVVYIPPQDYDTIVKYMDNLVAFINDEEMSSLDPLIKMAIIHHQFESIHPFYDGNGRTGRILNILYLVQQGLLNIPVLYLSRFIIEHKSDYYRLLQSVRQTGQWEEWLIFLLKGVEQTAQETMQTIDAIKSLMLNYKQRIRSELGKIYSQDLLNNLFRHPYTKIEFLQNDLGLSRQTAANYLEKLLEKGLLMKQKIGKSNYYVNTPLFSLFAERKNEFRSDDNIVSK